MRDEMSARAAAAQNYRLTLERYESLGEPVGWFDRHGVGPWRTSRLRSRADTAAYLRTQGRTLGIVGAGSTPGVWGSLSSAPADDGGRITLERTVECFGLDRGNTAGAVLTGALPLARLAAEDERQRASVQARVDTAVMRLLGELERGSDAWWSLLGHLPGSLRPLPVHLDEFEQRRRGRDLLQPATVSLREPDDRLWLYEPEREPRAEIHLHDIVVPPARGRRGIATAALQHLARYADKHDLHIVGEFIPAYSRDDTAMRWAARWYRSLGFQVRDESWHLQAPMKRKPQPPHANDQDLGG